MIFRIKIYIFVYCKDKFWIYGFFFLKFYSQNHLKLINIKSQVFKKCFYMYYLLE